MEARRNEISPGDLASEAGGMMTGLGVLSVMWVPFAVPALVMGLVLVLPLLLLAPPLLAGWLLVRSIRTRTSNG
jgi:hypothetical protein